MYVPLYVKTVYSLLSSLVEIKKYVKECHDKNFTHIAICDDNMYGVIEFYKECQKQGMKPIIGLEVKKEDGIVLLYAKDYQGYQGLMHLSTVQSEKIIKLEDIKPYLNHLIVILPYEERNNYEELKALTKDIYIGFENKEEERELEKSTSNTVFLKKVLYLDKREVEIFPFVKMIRDGKTIKDPSTENENNHHLLSFQEVEELASQKGKDHSIEIANQCNIIFPKAKLSLPIYKTEQNIDASIYLKELSKKGMSKRLNNMIPNEYKERLYYELEIIEKMGFSNYFLIVYDFIRYAKKEKILVGPGRGSAAGSLVSYSLGITDIDPIKYDLLFERFLNPERVSMPDIDTDFPDKYRDQVIEYVIEKYGQKKVAGIVTFGTLGSKQAIRDVARTLNIPIKKVDYICKFLPSVSSLTLKDHYEQNKEFQFQINSDNTLKKMFDIACHIEGFPRHTSIHAAGIVMSEEDLDTIVPLVKNDNMYLTAYSMEHLEEFGLLKMDFLGLKNLTTIMNILSAIEQEEGESIEFSKIPLDDKKALELFTTANTSGIFQFESAGMRNFLRKLKPTTFEDIFAAIALFRPGPAVNIDTYIRRKHKEEEITYLHPSLKPILENTYGIIIYQEQIMQIAKTMADYTLGEADILRRAMSKKKYEILKNEESKFISNSVKKGYTKEKAKEVFDLILNFANYGFNRAHSVAYSIIAYKMAYLKAHYPKYFYCYLLSSVIGSETKTKEYLYEAKANHIEILKPNINTSKENYQVTKDGILFPLENIKGVGYVSSHDIISAREKGPFLDLYDCIARISSRNVSKKTLESLIYASCFSDFGYNRATLIHNLTNLIQYADLTRDLDPSFVLKPEIEIVEEFSKEELLILEKDIFGFYLSNHPTTRYRAIYKNAIDLLSIDQYFNKRIEVIALVEAKKEVETKKQEKMAFVTASDESATVDFTLFPKEYTKYKDILEKGSVLRVIGNVEKRLDKMQVIVNQMEKL